VFITTHIFILQNDEDAARLAALDKASRCIQAEVAGHGVLDPDSSPRHIDETRRYLGDFIASQKSTSTALELYETMLLLHPNRVNPGSLWAAAQASKPDSINQQKAENPIRAQSTST
jgi:hypothetical protein